MELIIREIKEHEFHHVQNIAKVSWNYTYAGIIPIKIQEKFLNSAYSDENMQRRVDNSLLLVAYNKEKAVGFANFTSVSSEGKVELGAIYLLPSYFGQGIGTALLKEGMEYLLGVKEIYINVEKDNKIGLNFYRKKGFEAISQFQDELDGHTLQTIQMVLRGKKLTGYGKRDG